MTLDEYLDLYEHSPEAALERMLEEDSLGWLDEAMYRLMLLRRGEEK